jgi:hypothetical protein
MAETIDEFLVDFYKTKNNEDISVDKIQEIKQTYGTDIDLLITDLYKKYDNGNISDEKVTTIKSTYNLAAPKQSKQKQDSKKEESWFDKQVGAMTSKLTEEIDEETKAGISKYSDTLSRLAQFKLPDEYRNKERDKFNNSIGSENEWWKETLPQARRNLEALGTEITDQSLQDEAFNEHIRRVETELINKKSDEILEEFETDFGVNRTGSVSDFIDFIANPGGTSKTEINYLKNKKELHKQIGIKQAELEKPYRDAVGKIVLTKNAIEKDIKELNEIESRFKSMKKNGEVISNEEYGKYEALHNKVKQDSILFDKEIEKLGENPVPSNNFETIKDLTLKTYDNLQMVENNVASAGINVVAGLGQLGQELQIPNIVQKWGGGEMNETQKQIMDNTQGVIDKMFTLSNEIKGKNAPVPSIGEVSSLSDFGMYMMDLASGQMVNTALTVAMPPVGLAIMAASAAGGKMHDMNQEMEGQKWTEEELAKMAEQGITPESEYKVPPKDINALQYFSTAAMYGGVEYLTEKVSLGILKGGFKNVSKAFDLAGKTGVNKTLKNLTKPQQLAKLGYNFGRDSFKEAGAEGIVQLTNNFADMVVLGNKDVSLLDGMTDAMAAGFFMGNMFAGPPAITAGVTTAFSSEGEFAQANKLNKQLLSLSEQRDKILAQDPSDPDGIASMLQGQIEQTLDKQMESMNKVRQRTLDMTGADRQGMIDQYNKEHKLRAEIDKINETPDSEISKENKAILINDKVQELAESEAIRERILADATFNADVKRQSDLSTQIRAENGTLDMVEYVVADNADSALDQGLAKIDAMDLTDQQKSALKSNLTTEFNDMKAKSASGESYNGFAWGDNIQIETQKDGEMVTETLNVPMTFALNKNNATVASHELGHQTMFKQFIENNPDAVGLVDDLEAYVKKNYKDAYNNFKAVRAAYETEGLSQEQMAEEQLANLSDFMRMNNLQGDRTLHNKLFGRFQKVNDGNNQIETGKDVFDMLTSYNQSFETGQLQGLAKSVIKGKAKVKRKKQADSTQQQINELQDSMAQEAKKPKGKFSKFVQGETKAERSKRQDKRNVDVTDIYKADATGKNNEQWRDFLDSPKGSRVLGDMINMYYPDMIASAINKRAADPMEVASEAIEPLMKHIQAFNPEKNTDLAGYVGGYLGLKVGTGAKRVASKTPTISMEKEGVREVAEKQAVEETSKEEAPVRKGIKLAERLGDDAKKISEKVKKMKPVLEGKTYKTLKDLAPDDTQRMFGIAPKPGNLSKADVKNAQAFIRKNADILLAMLPEGTTVGGKATGVQKVLLDAFYTKGRRVKAAKTGSTQGLATQNKKPDIKISEFLEVFGITPAGQPNVSDRNTSSRIKALVDQTGKLLTNQAVREKAIEEGKPVEALNTITEGKSTVMFSKTLKDQNLETQEKIADVITSEKFLKEAEEYRKQGEPNWFYRALRDNVDLSTLFPESFKNPKRVTILKNIGQEFQMEFDPKKSWQDYVKKATKIQLEEAKIGVRTSLESIADGLGINIETGKKSLDSLDKLNNAREEIITFLKSKGYTQDQITKYISPALAGPAGLAVFELSDTYNKSKGSNLKLNKTDIKERSGGFRLGLLGNVKEVTDLFNIKGKKTTLPSKISAHGNWYTNFSRADQKKYGVKSFDQLSESKKNDYIKNELQPEGLEAKKLLSKITKDLREAYFNGEISAQSVATFVETQFAAMKGLGKVASDIRFIPTMSRADIINTFNLDPKDPFVLEHTLPANRIKGLMFNAILNPSSKALNIFEKDLAEYHSAIIPEAFDKKVNYKDGKESFLKVAPAIREAGDFTLSETGRYSDKKIFPMTLKDVNTKETFGSVTEAEAKALLPVKLEQAKSATPANEAMINSTRVMKSKNLNNEETIRQAEILDQALNVARDPNAPVKKIRVFDFDDTLARTKSNVLYTMPDGKTGKITPAEYAAKGTDMLNEGAEFDFSEFNKVMDGRKGPLFKVAETIAEKRGTSDMFVLTARSAEAAPAIKEFLDALGLNIPIENITGLGDSSPLAKSGWMVSKAAEGYNDFYFADDHLGNVKAVEKVMDLVDVKSKVQQAKIKFSKDVDQIFNDIIENKTGILSAKEYSAAKAKTVGAKKGRWKFWIAPSAEDFVGLLYPLLGKGALGDTQMAWFKEHLLDPYGRAMENLSRKQNRLSNDFKALKKALVKGGSIPKNLNKKAFDKWTYQDLSRVAAWHTQGFDIPGLSKADLNEMLDFIRENPGVKTFADQLIMINKGDGYAKPGKDWLAGTISTDLLDGLRTEGRSEYLQEWKANKDLIFSEKNLNKLEAAKGPKYREALEDMLRRMETGKNRTSTGNRLENRLLDYINNSVGTVMFLNMRSGILQTLSAVNFLNWSDNNPLKAGAAFANQPRYWKDFMKLMNSDFLIDRRNGLKINVSESEIADAARTSKNKAKAAVSYLLKKGFTVTQIMDSFAIASGGATFYRNRIKKYVKEGMAQADAEAKAYLDFREVAEESQQSARPDRISQQQASALGRVILAFANTPMQYNRIMKKAFLDLKNGRGDAKTHISKMIYYGAIQNMMFVALQQAMFAMAFDDEEEPDEVKRKKYMRMGNSMMDNILRGLGVWGTAASTLISITKKAIAESQKTGYPGADYDAAAMELLNFSPPIDIKISKLRQAGSNWKYEGWKHDEAAWSMEDPAYKSAAYVISALTNVPVDRFYKKMDNIQSALDSNNEAWKRVANILGWANWELESDADRKERLADEKGRKKDIKDKKKEEAAIEEAKAKEATMTPAEKKAAERQKKFDSYKALNKSEQVKMLLELGLTKAEIRALKYEKDRVDKLIELEE